MKKRVITAFAAVALTMSAGAAWAQVDSGCPHPVSTTSPRHSTPRRVTAPRPAETQPSAESTVVHEQLDVQGPTQPIVIPVVLQPHWAEATGTPPAPPAPAQAETPAPPVAEAEPNTSFAVVPSKKPVKPLVFDDRGKICELQDSRAPHECLKDHDITIAEMQAYCASKGYGPESDCFRNLMDLHKVVTGKHQTFGIFLGDAALITGDAIAAHNGMPSATANANANASASASAAADASAP